MKLEDSIQGWKQREKLISHYLFRSRYGMMVWRRVTTLKGMRRLDAGFILKVRPMAYSARLRATYEREKRSQAFDLNKSKNRVTIK